MKVILVLSTALAAGCAALRAPEIVAHRGASEDAPENSLAAFRLGWEQQADANELDLHLTLDGRLAVIHDASTKRTAGVDKPVARQTMAELKALGVPALEEVVALVPDGRRLFLEIKCGPEALPELRRVLDASGKPSTSFVIIGFGYDTMLKAKRAFPALPVLWIVGSKDAPDLDVLIARAREGGLDGLDLHHGFPIDAGFARRVREAGLKLYTWTVDDAEVARRQAAAGVDGITTNRPGRLRRELSSGR